jgi:MFS transporter, UMF1 family
MNGNNDAAASAVQRRGIFGWAMYDWANSAYVTTVAVAVLPAYFAAAVVPEGGWEFMGQTLSATSLWGYAVSLSSLLVFVLAPFLGAMADFSAIKRRMLIGFCYLGSLATVGLFFSGPGLVVFTLVLFVLAQIGLTGGNVFYDAFLPHVAPPHLQDRVSGKGFALGYIGGGLQFALSLGLIAGHDKLGLDYGFAARLAMASAGVWWGGFALITFARLEEHGRPQTLPPELRGLPRPWAYLRMGFARVREHTRHLREQKPLLVFLLAFLFYNDGIQTVISMATIYGKQELKLSTTTLMLTLLLIQFVAIFGALGMSRLAEKLGTRQTLMLGLVVWCGIAVYGYFLEHAWEYFVLGGAVGLVLGGSQALSRSLYSRMIPREASAEYFGYYSVVSKFSSIAGPFVFAVITQATGSSRGALLSLIVFFVIGLGLLWRLGRMRSTFV